MPRSSAAVGCAIATFDSPGKTYINSISTILAGHVEDVAAYTISNITLTVNGATSILDLTDGVFLTTFTLNEGDNSISATVTDAFDNTGTNTTTIIVDTVPPVISFSGAEDGQYYNRSVSVSANMADEHPDTLTILVNDNPYTSGTPIIAEGTYAVDITACDLAGNTARQSLTFHIDMTPPEIHISDPANGSFVSGGVVVDFSVANASPLSTSMLVDGVAPAGTSILDTTAYTDGDHNITINAQDAAGNTASESISVIVDNTPPAVAITSPANGSTLRGIVDITADVYDAYFANTSITINGSAVSNTSGYIWNTTLHPDGWYNITVTATGAAGNTATRTK